MAATAATCAPYQRVGVDSWPEGAEVFVDGELAGTTPLELRVGTEVEHSVFVKKEGFRSELVVLGRNQPQDGIDYVTPADIRVRLVPTTGQTGRELDVEVEPSGTD